MSNNMAYLARNTSRDDNNLDTLEGLVELVSGVALDLYNVSDVPLRPSSNDTHLAASIDVAHIGGDTGCTADIV